VREDERGEWSSGCCWVLERQNPRRTKSSENKMKWDTRTTAIKPEVEMKSETEVKVEKDRRDSGWTSDSLRVDHWNVLEQRRTEMRAESHALEARGPVTSGMSGFMDVEAMERQRQEQRDQRQRGQSVSTDGSSGLLFSVKKVFQHWMTLLQAVGQLGVSAKMEAKAERVEKATKGTQGLSSSEPVLPYIVVVGTTRGLSRRVTVRLSSTQKVYKNRVLVTAGWVPGWLTNYHVIRQLMMRYRVAASHELKDSEVVRFTKYFQCLSPMVLKGERPRRVIFLNPQENLQARREAHRMGIPTAAVVNADFSAWHLRYVDYLLPGNDEHAEAQLVYLMWLSSAREHAVDRSMTEDEVEVQVKTSETLKTEGESVKTPGVRRRKVKGKRDLKSKTMKTSEGGSREQK
jgi:ribosomal protein S2